jgi:hypothetical protein
VPTRREQRRGRRQPLTWLLVDAPLAALLELEVLDGVRGIDVVAA